MKKRDIWIFLIGVILATSRVLAADFTIVKSPQKVNVNGTEKEFEVYNIDGNNFFKLRDIAYVLNHTGSQFAVEYNGEKALIETQTGKEYIANGSEMKAGVDNSSTAVKSSQKIAINGTEKELLAYNIAGNNFFKLRELGEVYHFAVDFAQETNTVVVKSECIAITNVKADTKYGIAYVAITSENVIPSYTAFSIFEDNNNRIVIDIPYSEVNLTENQITTSLDNLTRIRMGDQGNHVNRFVLDVEKETEYQTVLSGNQKTLYVALAKNFVLEEKESEIPEPSTGASSGESTSTSIPSGESSPATVSSGETTPTVVLSGENTSSGEIVIDVVESGENIVIEPISTPEPPKYTEVELNNRIPITKMTYSSSTNKIKVTGAKTFTYTETTSADGTEIVIDIPNAVLNIEGPNQITPNNKMITSIEITQWEEMTVRLIIQLKAKLTYQAQESSKVLTVTVEEPSYQNLEYSSDKNGAKITLLDVAKEVFTTTEDKTSNKYTIKYSESRFSCGKETLEIADDWVDTIKITTGKIVVQGKERTTYQLEEVGKNVIVSITKTPETVTVSPITPNTNNNVVNRTASFTATQISNTRVLVGRAYINNSSGLTLDLNALSKKSTIAINNKTNVLIYHTHTTEGYRETGEAVNFHTTDNSLNVVAVGEALAKYLKAKGIGVYHDTTRNDNSYNDAYDASLIMAENDLKKAHYDIIIDLHRDAVSSDYSYGPTTTINGEKAAKMMFVMGSTAYGLEHPNWMENLKMAILIQNKAEEMYPGLFRDMSLVKYRYNQHLSTGGCLIEVGATGNSMEEVKNSMKYLANVMAALDK